MHIQENVSLSSYSTMKLGGPARWLAEAASKDDAQELYKFATDKNIPFLIIGQGSNIVWRDEGFAGLIIVNKILGREVLSDDSSGVTIRVGAGENWDEVVGRAVDNGWSGIEFLSKIPGTAGAAPVQNIGAYGAELSETLVEVEAYDTQTDSFGSILNEACQFSYRNSRFKSKDKNRFMITGIILRLKKSLPEPPFYESLTKYFEEHGVTNYTPTSVREAVTAIRAVKLPDPSVVANNGSFFTNPFVNKEHFEKLKESYPDIKGWPTPEGKVKLAAGWLVEQAGFKGIHDQDTGMATWQDQALVLVNEHGRKTADLLAFKQKVVFKVDELFGVVLEQEPELLP
ncbi:UDP-N-acetylmuramate dehydrogenase [Candidatus Saccharibacteria bacterium]|nr:UDP-N-acetylmuramate dehydrogenase [Candidatus Saccharibacteria bacterium]